MNNAQNSINYSKEALISVVLPVYNVEKYLNKSVESVCGQTYSNLEIILVDDGSTDHSGILCDEYAKKDSRISVIHEENSGLSVARNTGIEKALGDYIAFVDSDDWIAPEMIASLYERICADQADLAICGYKTADEEDNMLDQCVVENMVLEKMQALRLLTLNDEKGAAFGIVCNKLYKKELFTEIRFPRGKLHEDAFVMHRIVDLCSIVSVIGDYYYYYRQRNSSITKQEYSVKRLDCAEAFYQRYCFYREKGSEYNLLLDGAGKDFAVAYYQGKIHFRPSTREERARVREIDRMAKEVCFDNIRGWSPGMLLKLLAPSVLAVVSGRKKLLMNKGETN